MKKIIILIALMLITITSVSANTLEIPYDTYISYSDEDIAEFFITQLQPLNYYNFDGYYRIEFNKPVLSDLNNGYVLLSIEKFYAKIGYRPVNYCIDNFDNPIDCFNLIIYHTEPIDYTINGQQYTVAPAVYQTIQALLPEYLNALTIKEKIINDNTNNNGGFDNWIDNQITTTTTSTTTTTTLIFN